MKHFYKIILLIFAVLFLTGCKGYEIEPQQYFSLLNKTREFLVFCCYILDQYPKFHIQFMSRLYYAYFTLAKTIAINIDDYLYYESNDGSHKKIWRKINTYSPCLCKFYGYEMKEKRVDCDYGDVTFNNKRIKEDYGFIISHKYLFKQEIDRIKIDIKNNNFSDEEQKALYDKLNEILALHEDIINKSIENSKSL